MVPVLITLLWSTAHPDAAFLVIDEGCEKRKADPASLAFCDGENTPCSSILAESTCNDATRKEGAQILTSCMSTTLQTKCVANQITCVLEWKCKWVITPQHPGGVCQNDTQTSYSALGFEKQTQLCPAQ